MCVCVWVNGRPKSSIGTLLVVCSSIHPSHCTHTHSLTPSEHVVLDTARSKRKKDKNTDDLLCYVCHGIFFFPSPLCNSHSSLTPISEDRRKRIVLPPAFFYFFILLYSLTFQLPRSRESEWRGPKAFSMKDLFFFFLNPLLPCPRPEVVFSFYCPCATPKGELNEHYQIQMPRREESKKKTTYMDIARGQNCIRQWKNRDMKHEAWGWRWLYPYFAFCPSFLFHPARLSSSSLWPFVQKKLS